MRSSQQPRQLQRRTDDKKMMYPDANSSADEQGGPTQAPAKVDPTERKLEDRAVMHDDDKKLSTRVKAGLHVPKEKLHEMKQH
ncbi:hypothetical protein PROFUN_00803 [Planoprotostelium fungivorum]|uniref:Uncharacterized protein n=1 Tax=Planoprotostelium fungivorum TaxID=1890364 RepID=A0A2P6P039_9EUKA|nr:hypothetical protein PROFUN_00803 [Planoprotostelium fungivorum]